MKRVVQFAFGLLSLALGAAMLVWCAYCLFVPNQYFQWHLTDIPRLAIPICMIWVGWYWIRGDLSKKTDYSAELTVALKLSDADFGTESERENVLKLKHQLEGKLSEVKLGEIDGEEFGGGECNIFVHTNSPTQTTKLIRSFFEQEKRTCKITESEL
jgi:hypothetical protein